MIDNEIVCCTTRWAGETTPSFIRRDCNRHNKHDEYSCTLQFKNATIMGIILDAFMNVRKGMSLERAEYNPYWNGFWYFTATFSADNDVVKAFCKKYNVTYRDG